MYNIVITIFMSLYLVTLIMVITCKLSLMPAGRQLTMGLACYQSYTGKEKKVYMHSRQKWHTLCFSVDCSACLYVFVLYTLLLGPNVFSVLLLKLLQKLQQTMEKKQQISPSALVRTKYVLV